MSLEESMKELAESNLQLAKAMTGYAAVMDKYAANYAGAIVTDEAADPDPTPTRKRRTKAEIAADKKAEKEAAAAANEPDPFDDDEPGANEPHPELNLEDVRGVVMALVKRDRDAALAVLKKVGAETISKIDAKDFQKVVDLCAKECLTT